MEMQAAIKNIPKAFFPKSKQPATVRVVAPKRTRSELPMTKEPKPWFPIGGFEMKQEKLTAQRAATGMANNQ